MFNITFKTAKFFSKSMLSVITLAILPICATAQTTTCSDDGLDVVILGSGGPELGDKRASTGYLVREQGKARFLVDFGAGASLNFEKAGGEIEDLHAILFSHFHVDHSNDLPALIKASFFSDRQRDLPIYGPTGNHVIPSTPEFIQRQFNTQGVYPYLADFLTGEASFAITPLAINADLKNPKTFRTTLHGFTISAIPISHGLLPSLAWRIEKNGCSLTVSGDTSNQGRTLDSLAKNSSLFIAHNAVPEHSHDTVATHLHMTPSEIGRIAKNGVQSLILSHFMKRTSDHQTSQHAIRQHYQGKLHFANDCDIYSFKTGEKTGQC